MASAVSASATLDNLYQEKFGRAPDAAGKAYWQGQMEKGMSATEVAGHFDRSAEMQGRFLSHLIPLPPFLPDESLRRQAADPGSALLREA